MYPTPQTTTHTSQQERKKHGGRAYVRTIFLTDLKEEYPRKKKKEKKREEKK